MSISKMKLAEKAPFQVCLEGDVHFIEKYHTVKGHFKF